MQAGPCGPLTLPPVGRLMAEEAAEESSAGGELLQGKCNAGEG